MGGCKCSYVSCSKTSDGKTHFFHYPVRDPDRCHQWIINSNRSDFKSYTISQLKNKVVCEKHFADRMFMNYKKDRLIHSAVPNRDESADSGDNKNNDLVMDEVIAPIIKSSNPITLNNNKLDKEKSTMIVNVSPITGLTFFSPQEDKKQSGAPYIELLTRVHGKLPVGKTPRILTPIMHTPNKSTISRDTIPKNELEITNNTQNNDTTEAIKSDATSTTAISEVNNKSQAVLKKMTPLRRKPIYMAKDPPKTPISTYAAVDKHETPVPIVDLNVMDVDENSVSSSSTKDIFKDKVSTVQTNQSTVVVEMHETLVKSDKSCTTEVKQVENSSQTLVTNDLYANLMNDSERMLSEIMSIQGKIDAFNTKKEEAKTPNTDVKKTIQKKKFKPLSKASLYAQIVPYLSPELAKKVHMEMFPSMRHMHTSYVSD